MPWVRTRNKIVVPTRSMKRVGELRSERIEHFVALTEARIQQSSL